MNPLPLKLSGLQWLLVWLVIEGRMTDTQAQMVWTNMCSRFAHQEYEPSFWEMRDALTQACMAAGVGAP